VGAGDGEAHSRNAWPDSGKSTRRKAERSTRRTLGPSTIRGTAAGGRGRECRSGRRPAPFGPFPGRGMRASPGRAGIRRPDVDGQAVVRRIGGARGRTRRVHSVVLRHRRPELRRGPDPVPALGRLGSGEPQGTERRLREGDPEEGGHLAALCHPQPADRLHPAAHPAVLRAHLDVRIAWHPPCLLLPSGAAAAGIPGAAAGIFDTRTEGAAARALPSTRMNSGQSEKYREYRAAPAPPSHRSSHTDAALVPLERRRPGEENDR